jgi:hypothetical protein
MRDKLTQQIKMMQQQANQYLELHQQAVGAINALQWALSQLPSEDDEPVMTVQQLTEAIERGQAQPD